MVHCKIFIIIILFSTWIFPQKHPDTIVDSLLRKGIQKIITQDYNFAKNIFKNLDDKYPVLPLGKIYLAAVEITKSYDYAEEFNEAKISGLLESAIKNSEELIDKNSEDVWNHYYLALANGYYAYYEALNENWLNSISYGTISIKSFEKCLEYDKNFYEAFIALGSFKYWKSRKLEIFNWLPMVQDETEEGIKLLEKSIEKNSYNKYLAINSLNWIYIDKNKFYKAIELSEKALKEFPECRMINLALARAYEENDKKKAIDIYLKVLNSYPANIDNRYNEIVLKHHIAQEYRLLNQNRKALNLCEEILRINLSPELKEKLNERLLRVMELRTKLMNSLN